MTTIGVLALQGDFEEHAKMLKRISCNVEYIRLPEQLDLVDGLIIPGGESTTIVQLMGIYGFTDSIKRLIMGGLPVWGTCAGMIVLSKELTEDNPRPLGLIDIRVERNAFGRQVDSFETDVEVPVLGTDLFRAVFIRAPVINEIGTGVASLCELKEHGVIAARQDNVLVTSFHPELTEDYRFHEYFVDMVTGKTA